MEKLGFKNTEENITTPFGISKVILLLPTRNLKVFYKRGMLQLASIYSLTYSLVSFTENCQINKSPKSIWAENNNCPLLSTIIKLAAHR
jgi:hypothetical protein